MRKLIVLVLAISLLGLAPAQAAVKAGGKCAKAGRRLHLRARNLLV